MVHLILLLAACRDRAPDKADPPEEVEETGDPSETGAPAEENERPPAPAVRIEEGADGGLTCALDAYPLDPDGDAVTVSYAWAADTGFTAASAAIPPADAARGEAWTCAATASDAGGPGGTGEAAYTASGPVPRQYAFERVMDVAYGADLVALEDGTLLVATLAGELLHIDPAARAVLGAVTLTTPEQELMSIALDPRFGDGTHDHLYFWTGQGCRLGRVELALAPLAAADALDVRNYDCPVDGGHSSGDLLFWDGETPDPTLYLAVGPTGNLDPQDDLVEGEGIFAFSVDAATGEATAAFPGSPFANPEHVATGLRNPWRLIACGPYLCAGDAGHMAFEEIDLYTGPGQNFGAGVVEGPDLGGVFDPPLRYWEHDDPGFVEDDADGGGELRFVKVPMLGVRVSGRGYAGRLENVVLYGDFYDGWIRGLPIDDDGNIGADVPLAHRRHVMAMAEGPDGTVWAIELGGTLQRLILRGDRAVVDEEGAALSATGYADALPFAVRFPLWSNGAEKERRIEVPAGQAIDVSDPNAWIFPVGTRLWKTFTVDGAPVETRLIEKTAAGWVAGVYVWSGEDAYLTDGTRQELLLPSGGYTVPSQESCAFCHAATPGREWPLGLEPFQLGEDELAALAPLLSGDPGPVPEVAGESTPLAVNLRSQLHANCAFCHADGSMASLLSETQLDFRYDASSTNLIGERVNYYHDLTPYGPPQEYLVVPGDPESSVLLEILEHTDMPPVSVWREDTALTDDLREWILSLEE